MYTTYTKPRLSTSKHKQHSSHGNHKSRRNVRQIQSQLDSLKARQSSSLLRNSELITDISRLKQQVTHMNVSFNKLERARDSYDRYVETCMVSWIQKAFRESGTDRGVSSKPEPEPKVHRTPTKTIGIQTTHEHLTMHESDWSISPETESQLVHTMHSTMLVPNVTSKPPRDTSHRHNAPSIVQARTDTSLVPPVINFSDLRTPNMPPDTTFMSSHEQSNLSVYPSVVKSLPESPVPPVLPVSHLQVPTQSIPSNSTPTLNFTPFHSFPNVSMIAPHEGVPTSQHSYLLPQQPVWYVDMSNIRPQFKSNHQQPHAMPMVPNLPPQNSTMQPSVIAPIQATLPSTATIQTQRFSLGQVNAPQNDINTSQANIIPTGASYEPIRFPGSYIPTQDFTINEPITQGQYNMPPNATVLTSGHPQFEFTPIPNTIQANSLQHSATPVPPTIQPLSDTYVSPINNQENVDVSTHGGAQFTGIPQSQAIQPPCATYVPPINTGIPQGQTIQPPNVTYEPPGIPQVQSTIESNQPPTISQETNQPPSVPYNPETTQLPTIQPLPATQPLHTSDIRTLSPQSTDSGRQQVAQPLRHNVSPQHTKPAPPLPTHSVMSPSKQVSHHEPQLSHSRQPSTLPTIPEPQHETGEMAVATHEPPPLTATNTSTNIPRVPSAQEFQLQHLVNLERRATLDLGERPGSEFDLKFSLNPSVSIAPTDTSNPLPRHNSVSTPTLDTLDIGLASEESSVGDKGDKLGSSRNQFDLTAGEGSDEEITHIPSHIMVDKTAKPPVDVSVIRKIGAALNAHCHDTTISTGVKIYESIPTSDKMKGQIADNNVITKRILSQAEAPDGSLASWDIQTLGATFLSEIWKYVTEEKCPIITDEMLLLLLTSRVDLETFNRLLPVNCQDLWRVMNEHFASLIEAKMSADEICVVFTPYLMKASSSSEDIKKGSRILVDLLNEMFDLEAKREILVEPDQYYSSDSESEYVPENKDEAYQNLLKSMAFKSVDKGVKSGPEEEDIISIPSSIVSEGSGDVDLDLMVSPVDGKIENQSPRQLLDEAVGEKMDSSDSESIGEDSIKYVPDFGGTELMSDREKKKKIEKLWGADPDSGSEAGSFVKQAKKKDSLDDFDFF